ncbi:general bacterial porin family protein [Segatella baroniae F0067]|uniref:General bacterial porin family protein n=1 Tax=Segatella baroniae F0067 TaxID=1115809 RepID=U2P775_9BACT|nr:porin [Segatella baroniae]ERK39549.1 general bacterial porin family protein [Segatella baroniae F0067]
MKKVILTALVAVSLTTQAQEKKTSWFNNVKLSGYGMTQYQYSSRENDKSNTFNLRMFRLSLDGRIMDEFYWKAQVQLNGNTSTLGSSPRVVDLFAEWQRYSAFRVKIGQFKRPFTFENPIHPITQGFMSYSQNVLKLVGMSDRTGEHASNGRDLGIQIQGDFLPNAEGRNILHYQLGVFNGQGTNTKDVDQRKDVIGGIWVVPIKGLRLGVFGWEGSAARKGTWTDDNGNSHSGVRSLPKHRYAISGEYLCNDWTFRSEYVHSTGKAFSTTINNFNDDNSKNCNLSKNGEKADGYYALVIAPVIQKKLHAKARYDVYRPKAEWTTAKTYYEVGLDYEFHPNFQINLEYARVNDKSVSALTKHSYNMVDVEVDFKF